MTTLQLGSKLTRKTAAVVQRRQLVVTLHPGYLDIRQERSRKPFSLTYDAIYRYAAQLAADRLRAERKAKKKERSK
jgi:hypothetical protein